MMRHLLREVWVASAISLALLPTVSTSGRAQVVEPFQQVGDIRVYVGVIPARIAQRHPSGHAEAEMHGKPSTRDMHLVVALFDARGDRIENASVTTRVLGPGHTSEQRVVLEPMKIADTVTFGGFVRFGAAGRQTIEVRITRYGGQEAALATFSFVPAR